MHAASDSTMDIAEQLRSTSLQPATSLFASRTGMDDLVVYGEIFKYLLDSPASILRLAKTCKAAHSVVHEWLSGAYNINKHLRPYFDEPLEFRSLQARTATLISGSNALQFFTKVYYDYSDLDLYVPSRHRQEVGRWLLDRGYTYEPHSSQNPDFEVEVAIPRDHAEWIAGPYNTQGISAVFTFTKPSTSVTQPKRKQVQLIVATTSPMAAVLAFHSTVVQNVISWDRAYSMYPRVTLTFKTAFIVNRDRSGGRYNKIKNKYIDRGFEFYGDLKQEPGGVAYDDPAFTGLPRQLGDGHCWTLPLSIDGVTPPPAFNTVSRALTRDPCCFTMWVLEPTPFPHHPGYAQLEMKFDIMKSGDLLYYDYVKLEDQRITLIHPNRKRSIGSEGEEEREFLDQDLVESCEKKADQEQICYTWD